MAIKIQGSTIIDDSRNIVSAGIATINTKIDVGAGGTIFSADANISNDNILSVKNVSLNPALDITGIGSVGIGITNPSKTLHVDGTGLLVASGSTTLFSVESFIPNSNVFEVYDRENSIILGVSTSSVGIGSTNIFTITPQVTQTAIGIGTDELITLAPNSGSDNIFQVTNASGSTKHFVVANNGNIGVGTTNPSRKLHIDGDFLVSNGSTEVLEVNGSAGNPLSIQSNSLSPAFDVTGIGSVGIGTTQPSAIFEVVSGGSEIFRISDSPSDNYLEIDTDKFVVNSSGNIGINTTSITFGKLQVTQSSDTDEGGIGIVDSTISRSMRLYCTATNAVINSGNGGSGNLILNEGSGKVGIGTDNPGTRLEISAPTSAGAISNALSLTQTGTGSGTGTRLLIGYDTAIGTYGSIEGFYDGTGTSLTFGTSDNAGISQVTERLRITSTGNIGIGSTQPTQKLDVKGKTVVGNPPADPDIDILEIRSSTQSLKLGGSKPTGTTSNSIISTDAAAQQHNLILRNTNGNGAAYGAITFETGDTTAEERLRISKAGNVGIGTDNPTEKLDIVVGTVPEERRLKFGVDSTLQTSEIYSTENGGFNRGLSLGGSDIIFTTDGGGNTTRTERLRITSDGIVQVGASHSTGTYGWDPTFKVAVEQGGGDSSAIHFGESFNGSANPSINFLRRDGSTLWSAYAGQISYEINKFQFKTAPNAAPGSHSYTTRMTILQDGNIGIGTTNPSGAADPNNTTILNAGIVTANFYYGDGSGLTNLPAAVSPSSNGEFYTGISSSVQITPLSYETSVFTFPSTAGKQYVIETINVANVDTSVGVGTTINIIASIEDSTGEQTYIAYNIPIVNGGLVDLLKNPIVAGPSDVIKMWTTNNSYIGVSNAAEVYMNYTEFTSTEYISEYASTVSIATTDRTTIYTSSTYPTTIESIHLANRTDSGDYPVSITITNGVTTTYLAKDLVLPRYSVVDILDRSKRIETNATIDIEVGSTSTIDVIIAGKQITS